MSTYIVGDIHGCFFEFRALLNQVNFKPQQDTLWITGDLVARGTSSLSVLRYVRSLGKSVRIVLGNHDLRLLAVYAGIIRNKKKDRLNELLEASDFDQLINWLRYQPILQIDTHLKLIMTHAGISPQWNLVTAQNCAREVESALTSDNYHVFLNAMYGDMPNYWDPKLKGLSRLRFITNVLTRMRYCFPNGQIDMNCKSQPEYAPNFLKPWFDLKRLIDKDYAIAFGHWSALCGKGTPSGIYAMDTGCCWGGKLTILRWEDKRYFSQPSTQVQFTSE